MSAFYTAVLSSPVALLVEVVTVLLVLRRVGEKPLRKYYVGLTWTTITVSTLLVFFPLLFLVGQTGAGRNTSLLVGETGVIVAEFLMMIFMIKKLRITEDGSVLALDRKQILTVVIGANFLSFLVGYVPSRLVYEHTLRTVLERYGPEVFEPH